MDEGKLKETYLKLWPANMYSYTYRPLFGDFLFYIKNSEYEMILMSFKMCKKQVKSLILVQNSYP